MNQIKCPNCGTVFTINESDYSSIVAQIKDHTFEEELKKREKEIEQRMLVQNQLSSTKQQESYQTELSNKDKELEELRHQLLLKESEFKTQLEKNSSEDKTMIAQLKGQLENNQTEKQLAVQQAVNELNEKKNSEIQKIQKQMDQLKNDSYIQSETLRNQYDEMVKTKDREIADQKALVEQYKDFKVRLSTKMIGESLEQHCSYEFNRNRMGMFPHAYFEKDNDVRSGSKGDFIFRDYDEDGTEIISIMFEMKNENETTSTKHKNEDFFKELDKDRKEKGCEYAVLCSMLEADSDLYNEGIVDVSYKYPKMYVIRPQFFIPIITLLRNASMNALDYKKQLMVEKNNNLDLSNFEDNMNKFKEAFGKNYATASKKFSDAIDEIDKSISHLQKIKEALTSSDRQLRLANDKAQDLTIRKLTKNAPSVQQKLEEVKKNNEE
jgi:hypothetical protein